MPIINRYFKGNNIRPMIILTGVICIGAVMIGKIDSITPIITIFFLVFYMLVNFCCLWMELFKFSNWRPIWKYYHPVLSFFGMCLCIFLMIMISWWSFIIALVFVSLIYHYVSRNTKDK